MILYAMNLRMSVTNKLVFLFLFYCSTLSLDAYVGPHFKVIAFYTAKNDKAHISFVHEANRWFKNMAKEQGFIYEATTDWEKLNDTYLKAYQVVIFLDTRPESDKQRKAFERYMKNGGAWIGFHFAGFALDHSAYPNNWSWYQDEFLGCGEYQSNTWRPTAAILKLEDIDHALARGLPEKFKSAPNEWYRWKKDLRLNSDIKILLSIDPQSFPLGTGPKPHEIWHNGYYPVVWTNRHYRMVYFNMGHNDIDYESGSDKELSFTFENQDQNKLVLNALWWLAQKTE